MEKCVMTNKELKLAIKKANEDIDSLSRNMPPGPFPEAEVRRREMILLKQMTLYKIVRARKQKDKVKEFFNIALYRLMTSFLESYEQSK